MKILQTYSIREDIFGDQEFNFLVSDSYSELFNADNIDIHTDIFELGSSKKDLEMESFIYGIDELQLKIRETSIQNTDDKNAMFFCLDATNIKIKRFVAVYMGSIAEGNLEFVGKIESKTNGDDIVHNRADWSESLGAKREYSLTALSIDFALLEEAVFEDKITDVDGEIIPNVYDRIKASDYAELRAIESYSMSYPIKLDAGHDLLRNHYDNHKQVNVYKALNMYLGLASDILQELYNIDVDFNLTESDLGIYVNPSKFELDFNGSLTTGHIKSVSPDTTQLIKLVLGVNHYQANDGDPYGSPSVHRGMIDPEITKTNDYINIPVDYYAVDNPEFSEIIDWKIENKYSWKRFKNVSVLIYSIARLYGCFVKRTFTYNAITIQFIPRKDFNKNNNIRLLGAKSGSIETGALSKSERKEFSEFSNYLSIADTIENNYVTLDSNPVEYLKTGGSINNVLNKLNATKQFISNKEQLETSKDKDVKIIDLPISISNSLVSNVSTSHFISVPKYNKTVLFNTTERYTNPITSEKSTLYTNTFSNANLYERLHSGQYIACLLPEHLDYDDEDALGLGVRRPVYNIHVKIGDENFIFKNFTDYLKKVEEIEKKLYETTYTITVPFWNAFAEDGDGLNPSWKLAELGTNVRLSEYATRYIAEEFNESLIENDFTIISIERNLSTPETTIKLSLKSRFAFGYYDSLNVDESSGGLGPTYPEEEEGYSDLLLTNDNDYVSIRTYIIEDSVTIVEGDAVSLLANGKIVKTESDSDQNAEILGVCLNVIEDTQAEVLLSGIVFKDGWSWANIGDDVYARTNVSANISQSLLVTPNSTEDLLIIVGKAISAKELFVNPIQIKYEDGKTS